MRTLKLFVSVVASLGLAARAEPVILSAPGEQPQLALDPKGAAHVAFGHDDDIYYTHAETDSERLSEPMQVGRLRSLALGMRRGPRIATSKNGIVISAIGQRGETDESNVYAWRATTTAGPWNGPVQVNDVPNSAREGLHAMAAVPGGLIYCVWLDLRNKGTEVFGSRSEDGGATWSPNRLVYRSPDGTVCECCHPSVVIDADDQIHVMWRNWLAGSRDMYLASSVDKGETFGPATKLGEGTWPLNACPMDGGAVALSTDHSLSSAWRREDEVFTTDHALSHERLVGPGVQPWIAGNVDGFYAVWVAKRGGELLMLKPNSVEPVRLSENAAYPVVATALNSHEAVVAWEATENGTPHIKVARVNDRQSGPPSTPGTPSHRSPNAKLRTLPPLLRGGCPDRREIRDCFEMAVASTSATSESP